MDFNELKMRAKIENKIENKINTEPEIKDKIPISSDVSETQTQTTSHNPINDNSETKSCDSDLTQNPIEIKKSVDKKPKAAKKSRVKASAIDSDEICSLKTFPKSLVNMAKAMFPDSKNNVDAVSAYMCYYSEIDVNVSDNVRQLVLDKRKDGLSEIDALKAIKSELSVLAKNNKSLADNIQDLFLIVNYLLLKTGIQRDKELSLESVNFNEFGLEELTRITKNQTEKIRKQDIIKNGRPIS